MSEENYDATWLDYMPTVNNHGHSTTGSYVYTTGSSSGFSFPEYKPISYNPVDPLLALPVKDKKNKIVSDKEQGKDMASGYTFSAEDREDIEESVREAIIGPKKQAEIATRTAAVEALGVEDSREVGTVLTFKRKINKEDCLFVALKAAENKWYVSGLSINSSKTWEELLAWMTTGETLVSDVQIATAFEPITWEIITPSSLQSITV